MPTHTFDCGCTFNLNEDGRIDLRPSQLSDIPLDCLDTWGLIGSGNTKGIFQIESFLGQSLSKRLKPRNIEELSALISLMRPSCLEAEFDGKNLTNHYIDRRHGYEEAKYIHPALEPILKDTYGIMTYQEQSLQIARDIAGFTLAEADTLRKGIGKKKVEIIEKCKLQFLEGCKRTQVVPDDVAEQIWSEIEKAQRYQFNHSHAISYAVNGYLCAYIKTHLTKSFFTSYITHANEKQKPLVEIAELINNTKLLDIEVRLPSVLRMNSKPLLHEGVVYLGLSSIKDVGESIDTVLLKIVRDIGRSFDSLTWLEFLFLVMPRINKTAIQNMIMVGAIPWYKMSRTKMLYEYRMMSRLTEKECNWAIPRLRHATSLSDLLQMMVEAGSGRVAACANKNRINIVNDIIKEIINPPISMSDSLIWIEAIEEALLGVAITCSSVEGYDISDANYTCKDFLAGKKEEPIILAAKIAQVREWKITKGDNAGSNMAFIKLSDNTATVDGVMFTQAFEKYGNLLNEGFHVLAVGERSKKDSFNIKSIRKLKR